MTNSNYSRSPKLLKGALISFSSPMLIPIPNLIIFQYNPESISRSLAPWAPLAEDGQGKNKTSGLAQPMDPEETFSLNLELDATDALEEPASHPVAVIAGVADRLAAMEMLLYAPDDSGGAFGLNIEISVSVGGSGIGGSAGGSATKTKDVPCKSVPIALFFWGPGRIVPVRLTTFSVEEQAFSPLLYPVRAKVAMGMKILDEATLDREKQTAIVKIAKATYIFTRTQKQVLAIANLANSVESIMGMLPF